MDFDSINNNTTTSTSHDGDVASSSGGGGGGGGKSGLGIGIKGLPIPPSGIATNDAATASSTALITTTTTDGQQQPAGADQQSYVPSVAGSVIQASTGIGGEQIQIRIQNISSTANLGVALDLKKIALKCRNTEYNPRRFAAVIMRLRAEPRATALVFASGKMVVTGVKSTHNATLATKKLAYIIEKLGFTPVEQMDFKVQNIVGTTNVGFPIRLEGLVYSHSAFASYEPELFPGLIYRLVNPRVVLLIFVSGKIVITGGKRETDLSNALTKIYPVLVEFKKSHIGPPPPPAIGTKQLPTSETTLTTTTTK